MTVRRENRSTRRNVSPIATLSTTNLTWTGLRPIPVIRGMRLKTNRQIVMNITRCVLRNYYSTLERRMRRDGSRFGDAIFKTFCLYKMLWNLILLKKKRIMIFWFELFLFWNRQVALPRLCVQTRSMSMWTWKLKNEGLLLSDIIRGINFMEDQKRRGFS